MWQSESKAGFRTEENLGQILLFLCAVNCLFCIVHSLCTLDFILCAKQTMGSVLARWISISSPKWRLVDAYPAKKVANYYNNPQHHHTFPLVVIISYTINDPNLYYARSIFVLKGRYREMPHKFQSLWRSRAVWKNFSPFLLSNRWCASASTKIFLQSWIGACFCFIVRYYPCFAVSLGLTPQCTAIRVTLLWYLCNWKQHGPLKQ